ncbi:MAG: Crp/Fnr family transcriptional regulator [Acidimicrobiales bacterium]|nr:Crp/Fnr family transcriptional regulator [Acidimicrobiales bacterium]RZV46910.1 MAG: Crp/Fnr family transcriptional regulator [Acidimicrobiales bacterium]
MTQLFMDALSPTTFDALRSRCTHHSYPANAWVLMLGHDSTSVLFVESGLLRIERPTTNGRTVLLELTGAGSTIGELGVITGEGRSANVITAEPSTVLSLRTADFLAMLDEFPDFNRYVLTSLSDRIVALTSQLIEASERSATGRVAARLIELLDRSDVRHDTTPTLALPISQAELGQWAGLSREGTAKALRELRDTGVVETGRMRMTILNPVELRELARSAGSIR